MKTKYVLLRSSWGIVIFLDVEEIRNPIIFDTDVSVCENIFLRLGKEIKIRKDIAELWLVKGIRDLAPMIKQKIFDTIVCFDVKSIDFNYVDFQEEGLYCAIQEWIAKCYELTVEPIKVEFDTAHNRYIFDIKKD